MTLAGTLAYPVITAEMPPVSTGPVARVGKRWPVKDFNARSDEWVWLGFGRGRLELPEARSRAQCVLRIQHLRRSVS